MQLNFLDEGNVAAPQEVKKKTSTKNKKKTDIDGDLFGGLPDVAAPVVSKEKKSPASASAKSVAAGQEIEKTEAAFKTISEVAGILSVPQHVLRFWETRFSQIKPLKMGGGRRYYRPEDIDILRRIHNLLYKEGYTIKGAKKAFINSFNKKKEEAATGESGAEVVEVKALSERQRKQASSILKEMLAMREELRPYLAA